MRILFLTHSFNSLAQRLYADLAADGHTLSVEFDIADPVTEEAVALFRPDLVLAPFLKRPVPAAVWQAVPCFIVHPGIVGDRGPSALDWAIQEGAAEWGVTVLQAEAELDGGPVWASASFAMRPAAKSSLYRREVTEAASRAVRQAIARFQSGTSGISGTFLPARPGGDAPGRVRPLLRQAERAIDWRRDGSAAVLAKIRAADGFPGVLSELCGVPCRLFDAHPEGDPAAYGWNATNHADFAGRALARRHGAVLVGTRDGAVWIGHARRGAGGLPCAQAEGREEGGDIRERLKLPATLAIPEALALPEAPLPGPWKADVPTWQDIAYEEAGAVGFLHFDFYNGAMGPDQCRRLTEALRFAAGRPTRVIVLLGGAEFWSNGIHLNLIEAADSPADASWAAINAMDDLAEALLTCTSHLTVAALQGNVGAGGAFLARAADHVWVRDGVIANPHYKNMGNLYGSEFWTYLLPPRVGAEGARRILAHRLPMSAGESVACGFYDAVLAGDHAAFRVDVARRAAELAELAENGEGAGFAAALAAKAARRAADEAAKPLAAYRAEELAEMRRNFYGFDPSYHVARYHFVTKTPQSWTPRHLARHREPEAAASLSATPAFSELPA